MRRLGAIVAVTALLLPACTTDGEPTSDQDGSSVRGTIEFWDSTWLLEQSPEVKRLIAQFESDHPDALVTYRNIQPAQIVGEFARASLANRAPDVVRLPASVIPGLAAADALLELGDRARGEEWEDNADVARLGGTSDGVLRAIPQSAEAPMLLVRDGDSTTGGSWDAIAAAQAGPVVGATSGLTLLPIVYATDGRMLDTAAQEVLISAEPAVAGFRLGLDQVAAGSLDVPEPDGAIAAARRSFVDASAPALLASAADAASVRAALGAADLADLRVLPPPAGPDGKRGTPYEGQYLAVSAQTTVPDAAQELVAALTGRDAQTALAGQGAFPTRLAVYGDDGLPEQVAQYREVLTAAVAAPDVPGANELYAPMWAEWHNMVEGATSARTGAQVIAGTWLRFLPPGYDVP